MLPRNADDTFFDFKKAKVFALQAAQLYLRERVKYPLHRYGFYHGSAGINRAKHVIECLTFISDEDKAAILAILLAIFGKPDISLLECVGRSSSLASMIANAFIIGTNMFGPSVNIHTIHSEIFSNYFLERVQRNGKTKYTLGSGQFSYITFDKTEGTRYLLQDILNSPEFIEEVTKIQYFVSKLNSLLTSPIQKNNLNFFYEFTEPFQNYKQNITSAFLNHTKIPSDQNIAQFFTIKDTACIAQVNKACAEGARENLPTNRQIIYK